MSYEVSLLLKRDENIKTKEKKAIFSTQRLVKKNKPNGAHVQYAKICLLKSNWLFHCLYIFYLTSSEADVPCCAR